MRLATLGSGSRGNATLIEAGGTRVLIDCGFGVDETERRLATLGVDPGTLDAILLTHEHSDHVRGVGALTRRHRLPVWSTAGTWRGTHGAEPPTLHLFSSHERGFRIGDLRVQPYPIPHDAREPCQFLLEGDGIRLGMLTDAGTVTPHAAALLGDCDALVLEFNHDSDLLRDGPYPPRLKARIASPFGHLSNRQALELLDRLPVRRLRRLVAAHLSEQNNAPERVRACLGPLAETLDGRLSIATQDTPSGWITL